MDICFVGVTFSGGETRYYGPFSSREEAGSELSKRDWTLETDKTYIRVGIQPGLATIISRDTVWSPSELPTGK